MLRHLELSGSGPADEMRIKFGERLNVITGDNGLGKSFLLEVAWWALTRSWAGPRPLPQRGKERTARLSYGIDGQSGSPVERKIKFDTKRQGWVHGRGRPPIPGFIVYARVDGGFAVMDPARNDPPAEADDTQIYRRRPTAFFFERDDVWEGLKRDGVTLCNGLIADWPLWQLKGAEEFDALRRALATLSPDASELLEPGDARRVDIMDARDIPTLRMPYGDVPVTHASAGMRRILALAYLLVWAWHEHRAASELLGEPPSNRVTLLIDEVEAHLHPRWQRVILPAALDALVGLGAPNESQVICATHSPLVLASLEGRWVTKTDQLFTLDLEETDDAPQARLTRVEWHPRGDVNSWLTSEIFDLAQPRSRDAERVIEEALAVMRRPGVNMAAHSELYKELVRVLPETDPLLARLYSLAARSDD